jgi:hypothetical protein
MNEPHFQEAIQMLHQNCLERKEPEWYLYKTGIAALIRIHSSRFDPQGPFFKG